MKVLMLGLEKHSTMFSTIKKILELEKFESDMIFFDKCSEKTLIKELRNSELFLMCPYCLDKNADEIDASCGTSLFEAVAAGYILAHKGRMMIFASDPDSLNDLFYGEPVINSIGQALCYFRREKKAYINNKKLLDARKIILDAHLSFSSKGFVEAVKNCMYKEAQAFLNAGFSTETEDENGVPVISHAVRNGDLELCRLLMSYDAALNIIARDRVTSPVMDAVTGMNTEIAELLIDSGADLNYRNRNGQSSLIVAIGARMEALSEMLVDKGADITIKDSLGMTAIEYAKLFSLTHLYEKLEKLK